MAISNKYHQFIKQLLLNICQVQRTRQIQRNGNVLRFIHPPPSACNRIQVLDLITSGWQHWHLAAAGGQIK